VFFLLHVVILKEKTSMCVYLFLIFTISKKKHSFRNPEHPKGGEIFFGGVDSQLFEGEIIYANVTKQRKQEWQIRLNE